MHQHGTSPEIWLSDHPIADIQDIAEVVPILHLIVLDEFSCQAQGRDGGMRQFLQAPNATLWQFRQPALRQFRPSDFAA
jgi:hypothetical protein